jgi:DNA-directed RNA polymerase subunit F
MILNRKPLSMIEATEYINKNKENSKELLGFMKNFAKIDLKKAKELKKKLEEKGLMKMKEQHIAKIIDLMPEDSENLNKIFVDVGLDEDETKEILKTIKEFK